MYDHLQAAVAAAQLANGSLTGIGWHPLHSNIVPIKPESLASARLLQLSSQSLADALLVNRHDSSSHETSLLSLALALPCKTSSWAWHQQLE